MATSSFYHPVVIDTKEKARQFERALEEAERRAEKRDEVHAPYCEVADEEIDRILGVKK